MTCDEAKPLLNSHLDGELDAVRSVTLNSHLETCLRCREDLEALGSLDDAIRSVRASVPAHLRDNVVFAIRNSRDVESHGIQRRTWALAAAAVLVAGLAAAPFIVSTRDEHRAIAAEIVSAHERALAARETDVISSDRHTVKPWFNGRLPFSPPVVDLSAAGFPLKGGRVDYIGGRPVAALVYGRSLHRIDLFVWPFSSPNPAARLELNGFHEISWTENGFVFSCVSDLDPADMARFAELLKSN